MPRNRFVFMLEYAALLPFLWALRVLPGAVAGWLGNAAALAAFYVIKIRRCDTERNIRNAFPGKDGAWVRRTAYGAYRNVARVFIEFARFPILKKRMRSLVRIEPDGVFDRLRAQGKGVVMVSAHFGSWEVLAAAFPAYGYPLTGLARDQKNGFVDDIIHELRLGMGVSVIRTNESMRGVLRALSDNHVLFILSDQSAGKRGVWIDFLGQPASAFQGAAQFHLKTGAPLVVCMTVRQPDGTYVIETVEPALPAPTGDRNRDITAVTQAYSDVIGEYVRRYPEQWLWMHRRWRSRKALDAGGVLRTVGEDVTEESGQ